MYWSYKNIPQLQGLDPQEAKRRFKEAQKAAKDRPGKGKGILAGGLGGGIGSLLLGPIGAGLGAGLGCLYLRAIMMENVERVLHEWEHSGHFESDTKEASS